jgi:hypothetical protein
MREAEMAEESEHVRKLMAAHEKQIVERRRVAGALAENPTEAARDTFTKIQSTIDAIERAIGHEKRIESCGKSVPLTGAYPLAPGPGQSF